MNARTVLAVLVALVYPTAVLGQSLPVFEVASIKPTTVDEFGATGITYGADSFRATNVPLTALIRSAYGLRQDRVVGGPDWVRTARFDVDARAGREAPREQLRLMVQRLLEDRFGVALKREQREQEISPSIPILLRVTPPARMRPGRCRIPQAGGVVGPTTVEAVAARPRDSRSRRAQVAGRATSAKRSRGSDSRLDCVFACWRRRSHSSGDTAFAGVIPIDSRRGRRRPHATSTGVDLICAEARRSEMMPIASMVRTGANSSPRPCCVSNLRASPCLRCSV